MNEPLEPLEAELKSLLPRGPSPDLRERIANVLDQPVPAGSTSRRWRWIGPLAASFIAATIVAGFVVIRMRPAANDTAQNPVDPASMVFNDNRPTYWTYQQALVRSPDQLDQALDQHSRRSAAAAAPPPTYSFTRIDANLLSNGEL